MLLLFTAPLNATINCHLHLYLHTSTSSPDVFLTPHSILLIDAHHVGTCTSYFLNHVLVLTVFEPGPGLRELWL